MSSQVSRAVSLQNLTNEFFWCGSYRPVYLTLYKVYMVKYFIRSHGSQKAIFISVYLLFYLLIIDVSVGYLGFCFPDHFATCCWANVKNNHNEYKSEMSRTAARLAWFNHQSPLVWSLKAKGSISNVCSSIAKSHFKVLINMYYYNFIYFVLWYRGLIVWGRHSFFHV